MNKLTPEDPGSRRRAAPVHGGGDRYEALLEVLEQQAERVDRDERPRGKGALSAQSVVLLVLLLLTVWVWVMPPAWLVPPPPAPAPAHEEEAALRFGMYLQAQRIRAYEMAHGTLPESLAEAGPPIPGMLYTIVGPGVYELTGSTERVQLTYRSTEPLREWVGSGADLMDSSALP